MADQRDFWLLLMVVGRSLVQLIFRRHWVVAVRLRTDPEPKAGQTLGRESRVSRRARMAAQSLSLKARVLKPDRTPRAGSADRTLVLMACRRWR